MEEIPKIQNRGRQRQWEVTNIPLETREKGRWKFGESKGIHVKQRIKERWRAYKKKMKIKSVWDHMKLMEIHLESRTAMISPKGNISVSLDTSSHARTIYYCCLKIPAKYSQAWSNHGNFLFLTAKNQPNWYVSNIIPWWKRTAWSGSGIFFPPLTSILPSKPCQVTEKHSLKNNRVKSFVGPHRDLQQLKDVYGMQLPWEASSLCREGAQGSQQILAVRRQLPAIRSIRKLSPKWSTMPLT